MGRRISYHRAVSLVDLHRDVAFVAVVAIALVMLEATYRWLSGKPASGFSSRVAVAAIVVVVTAGGLGAALYATGRRPQDQLHLMYGLIAVAAIPVAELYASGLRPRQQAIARCVVGLAAIGVIARLFMTG